MPVEHLDKSDEHLGERVILKHPKGSSAVILLYGATVISWKSGSTLKPEPIERLFISSKAKLDGSKPVRGGIPVVFPCFGAPTHPEHLQLSQHGFARSETWQMSRIVMDNEAGVSVRFSLNPTPSIQSIYPRPFQLDYVVTLAEHQLSTDIHVVNASANDLEFQALLHTYIQAPSDELLITPLQGLTFFDKIDATADGQPRQKVESRQAVDVIKSTDSVYENAPQDYTIKWQDGRISVRSVNMKDVVVWNPQEEGKKMSDMEDRGWKRYVCVEPGFVKGFVRLASNNQWIGQQVITVVE
ncbi:hypothetical protein M378DRAFT_66178 [Amanita muscaria Koide BX008]|uniref:Glucose-6-phosphate 1-epimerase n=1 Tax=Amanita muscaria (strain Koide BX008) TaxID=946122 RepID=A0A0C2TU26_AMAMK|nr:hypothetical protein M378DRAFT_66178 [Amanita muscaria Koide BX008]